jgi:hypothetical protein
VKASRSVILVIGLATVISGLVAPQALATPAAVPCRSRAAWSSLARTTGFGSGLPGSTGRSSPSATRSHGTTTRMESSRSVRDLSRLGSHTGRLSEPLHGGSLGRPPFQVLMRG